MSPILRDGYVKANGALLTSASTNYPRLVQFVTDNPSLKAVDDTAWASNKALYVYDDTNDTLRVPDATGRVLQGGSAVESVEAGVPNITGKLLAHNYGTSPNECVVGNPSGAFYAPGGGPTGWDKISASGSVNGVSYTFDASRSSSIYSASTTVQPPALTLIPQIKN